MSLAVIQSARGPGGNVTGRIESQLIIETGIILAEDVGTTNHANRATLAGKLLAPGTFLATAASQLCKRSLAVNSTAQTKGNDLSDSEIEYIIRSTMLNDATVVAELNALT
jgi:hypothetical protein